jgi:hypothetical protein
MSVKHGGLVSKAMRMLLFRQLNPLACMYKITVKSRNLHLVISTRKLIKKI